VTRANENGETCAARESSFAGCRSAPTLLMGILLLMSFVLYAYGQTEPNSTSATQPQAAKQHFACNVGYTLRECEDAATVLKKAIERYPMDALGEWTWVLVRTADWKQILADRKLDTNHPAFSYLSKRETFLDGALVVRSSIRSAQLCAIWHMPIEDLLDLAIRHEFAHALCNDRDETRAERAAVALKDGMPLSCGVVEQVTAANSRNQADTR